MKKIILLFALLISTVSFAQSSGFNYKALVVDNGTPVANRLISVKIKLKNGSSTKWYEQHDNVQTDANGIFSLSIGNGTRIGGTYNNFADINWRLYSNMKLTVEVNTGSGYHTLVNDIAFGSVPYAKQALKANVSDEAKKLAATNSSGIYLNSGGANSGIYFKHHPTGTDAGNFNIYQSNHILYFNSTYSDGKFRFLKKIDMGDDVKITATGSGDADLKAYAYGEWYNNGARHTTSNVTITKVSGTTGQYRVTFASSLNNTDNYIVVGNIYLNKGFINFGKAPNSFTVNTYNSSGSAQDLNFTFVVYKK